MTTEFPITIYHNSNCGTSRKTLALIEAAGYSPEIVDYRKVGWTRPLLLKLLAEMDANPRAILREKEAVAGELGLLEPATSDDTLIAAMLAHPILVNRPIVVTPRATRLCRPAETVLELLPAPS